MSSSVRYDRDLLPRFPKAGWGTGRYARMALDQYELGLRVSAAIDAENDDDLLERYAFIVGTAYVAEATHG